MLTIPTGPCPRCFATGLTDEFNTCPLCDGTAQCLTIAAMEKIRDERVKEWSEYSNLLADVRSNLIATEQMRRLRSARGQFVPYDVLQERHDREMALKAEVAFLAELVEVTYQQVCELADIIYGYYAKL